MNIIDSHAHIFPDPLAAKAARNIGKFYNIPMRFDGTLKTLLSLGARSGISRYLVQSVATTPEQVESINDFIAQKVSEHPDKLIGFATLHPDYPHIEKEIDRVVSLGLKGIKLHPDFQQFCINSKNACRIYEAIEDRLPMLIHTGDYRYPYSKPALMAQVLRRFPKLDAICAHLGGWSEWEDAASVLPGSRVWVDTSSSMYALKPGRVREIIDLFGVDHVVFGTDYPMWDPVEELDRLAKIELTQAEREMILHGNIERLLMLYEDKAK